MLIPSFPKIFPPQYPKVRNIFDGEIEITEKVDGSLIAFGNIQGKLCIRSKRADLTEDCPDMFYSAVKYIEKIYAEGLLDNDVVYYGECLKGPKHNVLTYNRPPKNNIAIFSVLDYNNDKHLPYDYIQSSAKIIEVDCVPLLFKGVINNIEECEKFLQVESFLGGVLIEGVVIKNYNQYLNLGGKDYNVTSMKLVSAEFKEQHTKEKVDVLDNFFHSFNTEARFQKALIHLKEQGVINGNIKDVSLLAKEIKSDLIEEEEEKIKEVLFNFYKHKIEKIATKGIYEWYKEKIGV